MYEDLLLRSDRLLDAVDCDRQVRKRIRRRQSLEMWAKVGTGRVGIPAAAANQELAKERGKLEGFSEPVYVGGGGRPRLDPATARLNGLCHPQLTRPERG
jgi:hypothetical protein